MPRKKSAVPLSTRLRENQRRSRTRRKELIEDLQQRLRDYEQKELQATMLMQTAARKVAWENAQLRDLLSSKGVSGEDIEDFVRTRSSSSATVATALPRSKATLQAVGCQHVQSLGKNSPASRILPEPDSSARRMDINRSSTSNKHGRNNMGTTHTPLPDQVNVYHSTTHELKLLGLSGTLGSIEDLEDDSWIESQSFPPSQASAMLEMSCDAAASIIAGIRSHGDKNQARSEIGCRETEGEHCRVANVKIMQMLGED